MQGPSWLHRGIWPLHIQEIVGHIVLAAIPLSISATAPCPASRLPAPHPSARYDLTTSLSRTSLPTEIDPSRLRICAVVDTTNPESNQVSLEYPPSQYSNLVTPSRTLRLAALAISGADQEPAGSEWSRKKNRSRIGGCNVEGRGRGYGSAYGGRGGRGIIP